MSAALAFAPGRIVPYDELHAVLDDSDAHGVIVVDHSLDFDQPRDNAEYVRGLGFLFNEHELVSNGRA